MTASPGRTTAAQSFRRARTFAVFAGVAAAAAVGMSVRDARAQNSAQLRPFSPSWVATDGAGRRLPTAADVGPPRPNKYVGVFYWLWHGYVRTTPIGDVSKLLQANPQSPAFTFQDLYWGEPEDGYYHAGDTWVARRNLQLLANAGVDFIFFDFTNGPIGKESFDSFMATADSMRIAGIPVPRFAFFLNSDGKNTLDWLYANVYQPGKYRELWFQWEGKPLLMGDPQFASSQAIADFFTIRHTWAFQGAQQDEWRFIDDYPQRPSWHGSPDKPEQICVSKAMGAPLVPTGSINNKGASYHAKTVPNYDQYWLCPDTPKGLYFEEQWSRAHEVDPTLVLVTGWNELTAGAWHADQGIAGNYTFMGRPLQLGDWDMVDEFNAEFDRDLEPMKGGYTDNYYYQLVSHVRKYKGLEPPPAPSAPTTATVDGTFTDWANVLPVYVDPPGDTAHRSYRNVDNSAVLVNTTGRNDFVSSRVAHDANNVYFYAKTSAALTPSTDPNWMLLYVDADENKSTGWQGYDFIVGLGGAKLPHTPVQKWVSGAWQRAGQAELAYAGNELEIAVPKAVLGIGAKPAFDFHWADNVQAPNDITEFFVNGDSAPDRRFDYRYEGVAATGGPAGPPDASTGSDATSTSVGDARGSTASEPGGVASDGDANGAPAQTSPQTDAASSPDGTATLGADDGASALGGLSGSSAGGACGCRAVGTTGAAEGPGSGARDVALWALGVAAVLGRQRRRGGGV